MTNKIRSFTEAAQVIPNFAVVTVSSSSGLACSDKVLAAIGERYRDHSEPRQFTLIHPIAAGDRYGIKGIDHLVQPGLIKRVVAGAYPSGPSSLPSPLIWQSIINNESEAYNLPSGVLLDVHRDAAEGLAAFRGKRSPTFHGD